MIGMSYIVNSYDGAATIMMAGIDLDKPNILKTS